MGHIALMSEIVLDRSRAEAPSDRASVAGPGDYFALLKPRVMSLVVFTAAVGMVAAIAGGAQTPPFGLAVVSLFAIAVGAGASGALNMWWDADIDRVMARTAGRPVPKGLVPRAEAAGFGGFLGALAVALLALSANYVAAGLLAFTIFFYVVIYSMWLKRSTPQNIVIGGAAGALPPVVGWAAITGGAPLDAWILFAIIFLWTPPHFWALALFRENDYGRAGVPMMPNVKGVQSTKRQIFSYAIFLAIAAFAPLVTGLGGPFYGVAAATLNAWLLMSAWRVLKAPANDTGPARALFKCSLFYLAGLFAAILAEDLAVIYG